MTTKRREGITQGQPPKYLGYEDELYKVLGEPFDEDVWKELTKDTSLFKLTWKQEFPKKKDGKDTFYAKLLDGTL